MTPALAALAALAALSALARQLAASPRWRWLPGMCWIQCPPGDPEEWTDRGRLDGYNPEHMARPVDAIPDLSDPVTAAGLAVLARMARGGLLHAEPCHGRGVVKRWEGPYTADVLGEGATEVEALAAVILRGGG